MTCLFKHGGCSVYKPKSFLYKDLKYFHLFGDEGEQCCLISTNLNLIGAAIYFESLEKSVASTKREVVLRRNAKIVSYPKIRDLHKSAIL